jgi:ABC-2 type transport system ATP-binding protein
MIASAHQLTKRFGGVVALDRVDWSLERGQIQALVGPNGAGKTTLLRTLAGIARPDSGLAELLGCDSSRLGPSQFQQIGFVAEGMELPLEMTLAGWLAYLRPFYPAWSLDEERALIEQLALPPDRKLGGFSRGMKMKAQLAAALAFKPQVVLLDEPFSGLDPLAREEFTAGLLERAEKRRFSSQRTILLKSRVSRLTLSTSNQAASVFTRTCRVSRSATAKLKWCSQASVRRAGLRAG